MDYESWLNKGDDWWQHFAMTQDQRVGVHEVSNWSFSLMERSLFAVATFRSHTDGRDISIPHSEVHNDGKAVQTPSWLWTNRKPRQDICSIASISSSSELNNEATNCLFFFLFPLTLSFMLTKKSMLSLKASSHVALISGEINFNRFRSCIPEKDLSFSQFKETCLKTAKSVSVWLQKNVCVCVFVCIKKRHYT